MYKYNSLSVLYIIELHSHFWLFLLSPVKIPVNDHFQAHVTSWGYISNITSSTGKLNLRRYRGPQKILKSIYKDIFKIFATKNAILKNKNYMPCIRKDPFELSPPTFGNCPNSYWTPPRTQPGPNFTILKGWIVLLLISAPNHLGKRLYPPKRAMP